HHRGGEGLLADQGLGFRLQRRGALGGAGEVVGGVLAAAALQRRLAGQEQAVVGRAEIAARHRGRLVAGGRGQLAGRGGGRGGAARQQQAGERNDQGGGQQQAGGNAHGLKVPSFLRPDQENPQALAPDGGLKVSPDRLA